MSMDVYLRLFLASLITAYTQAGPLSTASQTSSTPYFGENVPTCAQPCFQTFIAESFPSSVCSSPSIECLCTGESVTKYTIGEGALSCLVLECPQHDPDEQVSAYDICSSVVGAVSGTHTILTATPTALPTVNGVASTTSTSSTSSPTSILSSSSRLFISSASPTSTSASSINSLITTATSPSSSLTTVPFSSISAAAASTSSAPPASPILSKPQIAGIVVASIGAAALAFGLCFLLFCCRRRKQVKRHSVSSFGGDKVVGSSADSSPDLGALAVRNWGHESEGMEVVAESSEALPPRSSAATPRTTGEGGWSQWRRNTAPQDIGLALAPGPLHPSPGTPSSRRTRNSQLLPDKPDKPSYSLFPQPARPSTHSMRASQSLEALLASRNLPGRKPSSPAASTPRFPSSLDTSQSYMQGEPTSRSPSSLPQIFPYMQVARPQAGYQPYREPPTPELPVKPQWIEPSRVFVREPLPPHDSMSARGLRLGKSIHGQYPSNRRSKPPPSSPIKLQNLGAASTYTPRRKKSDPRPATWFSTGSETSFEDADAEDFPEPVSALTPVKEQYSPITYPRIPTTAAESPSRRPQIPNRSDSLLARRRGGERVAELEGDFHSGSSPSLISPSAKSQILQSPVLSEPLGADSSSSNSPRRTGKGAGTKPAPSGWPQTR